MRPQDRPEWSNHVDADDTGSAAPRARCALTEDERTRVSQAGADLDEARLADLTRLDAPGMIRMIERLRASLDDMLLLMRDLES